MDVIGNFMTSKWKHYCFTNKLPSSSTIEQAFEHLLTKQTESFSLQNLPLSPTKEIFKYNSNKNLLFLCHTIPTPDRDSGSNRIVEILKILINEYQYNIYYLTHDGVTEEPKYTQNLYDIGVKRVIVADKQNQTYCHHYIEKLCYEEKILFDTVIFEFYEMYCAYWHKIQYILPNIKTIVDSVDVHWLRKLGNPNNKPQDIIRINMEKTHEKLAYDNANVVFAVTEQDKEEILKECPFSNVKILSNIHSLRKKYSTEYYLKKYKDLIFVGGDTHPPNTDAAIMAISIFKRFIENNQEFTNSKLHIVGKRTNEKILSFKNDPNIVIYDYLSQTDLDNLYNIVYGALCPVTWGAGIKGKVCEAISNLIPVITTPLGASGLNLVEGTEVLLGGSEDEILANIQKLFSMDSNQYESMVNKAFSKLHTIAGVEAAKAVLGGTLTVKPIVLSIVTHNNVYLLQRCIESILLNTKYQNYKIFVTSNACEDNTPEIMKLYTEKYGHILYQYNTENKHFIQAHNEAISLFPDSDMVLLNEDIEIVSNCWLSDLYSAIYSAGYIGCAGGKTIYPDGTICEAGAKVYNNGNGDNLGRHKSPHDPQFSVSRYVGYVSGCMMYMRRDCIDKFGSMDMRYYPCYYEDSDWQYNLHINGYKTIYTPKVIAIHREGSSCGTDIDDTKGFKKFININKIKFIDKYKNYNIELYNT